MGFSHTLNLIRAGSYALTSFFLALWQFPALSIRASDDHSNPFRGITTRGPADGVEWNEQLKLTFR